MEGQGHGPVGAVLKQPGGQGTQASPLWGPGTEIKTQDLVGGTHAMRTLERVLQGPLDLPRMAPWLPSSVGRKSTLPTPSGVSPARTSPGSQEHRGIRQDLGSRHQGT